jgi:hypothetical protein
MTTPSPMSAYFNIFADKNVSQTSRRLPPGYKLDENDVFCGRGHLTMNHIGNRRFRSIIVANHERYVNAINRHEKTAIIFQVVDHIRSLTPNGGFIKNYGHNSYYEIGDLEAVRRDDQCCKLQWFRTCSNKNAHYFFGFTILTARENVTSIP